MKKFYSVMLTLLISSSYLMGAGIESSSYQVTRLGQYVGSPASVCLDNDNNLYIANGLNGYSRVTKISPDGNSRIISGYGQNYLSIVFTGNNLLVAEVYTNSILKIDIASGIKVLEATLPDEPLSLAIAPDGFGEYGGELFVGTRKDSALYSIQPFGFASKFKDYPLSNKNGIIDIVFDDGLEYGGNMYVTVNGETNAANECGVFMVDEYGSFSRFLPWQYQAGNLAFDETENSVFGGGLFASTYSNIFSVDSEGNSELFYDGNGAYISDFIIGSDDSMYVLSRVGTDLYAVDKITYVPEPFSCLFLASGAAVLVCRRSRHN